LGWYAEHAGTAGCTEGLVVPSWVGGREVVSGAGWKAGIVREIVSNEPWNRLELPVKEL
jgi:hypothetical protein